MSTSIEGSFINFALVKDIKKAEKAGVIPDLGYNTENEERHISELERITEAFDEKETYVIVKTLVRSQRKTFVKTLEYMEKEGE